MPHITANMESILKDSQQLLFVGTILSTTTSKDDFSLPLRQLAEILCLEDVVPNNLAGLHLIEQPAVHVVLKRIVKADTLRREAKTG